MGDMSTPGSRSSGRSLPKLKDKSKVAPATAIPADSKFVDFGRYRLRVMHKYAHLGRNGDAGREDSAAGRITLFFIHGVGENADVWRKQTLYFYEKGYEVVVPDLLGHGFSSKPRNSLPYLFDNLAKDILYIFDMFKGKRNVVIGHSYGTSFCVLLAKERSTQVSKMILISGGGPTPLKPDACSPFCCPLPIFHLMQPLIVKSYQRQAFHQASANDLTDEKSFSVSSSVLRAIMRGQQWPEATEEYHADLLVPVLILQGKDDKFMSLDDARWMNETIYGSDLHVINEAAHMVMMEQPDRVNELILGFLSRDPSTKPAVTEIDLAPASQKSSLAKIENIVIKPSRSEKDLVSVSHQPLSPKSNRSDSRLSNRDLSETPSGKTKRSQVLL